MTSKHTVVQRLAHGVSGLSLDTVPNDVIDIAKRCLIDVCGVTLAGASTKSAKMFYDMAMESYAHGPCSIVGHTNSSNAAGAAFANGTAAHALDFDDNCYAGIVHGSAVVFPAVLAMAQQREATGADILRGFIAGLEVEFAVGKALSNTIYDKGWWTTSVLGAIGSAAGAASVANLNPEITAHALALAAAGAGATRAVRGTAAKHYYCGRAAESGVVAVLLAMKGATGPLDVFEDQNGIVSVLNDMIFDETAINNLGKNFNLLHPGIDIKKYPVCYASHSAADATKQIMISNNLHAKNVASIICTVPSVVASNLTYNRPKTSVEAQFSLEFAIATILQYGDITLEHLSHDVIMNVDIQALLGKIEMRVGAIPESHNEKEIICPEWASVELVTRDGEHHSGFVGAPVGAASKPMSEKMLRDKFMSCVHYADTIADPVDLYNNLQNIENLKNTQGLFM